MASNADAQLIRAYLARAHLISVSRRSYVSMSARCHQLAHRDARALSPGGRKGGSYIRNKPASIFLQRDADSCARLSSDPQATYFRVRFPLSLIKKSSWPRRAIVAIQSRRPQPDSRSDSCDAMRNVSLFNYAALHASTVGRNLYGFH